jgi:hypothetical protein
LGFVFVATFAIDDKKPQKATKSRFPISILYFSKKRNFLNRFMATVTTKVVDIFFARGILSRENRAKRDRHQI